MPKRKWGALVLTSFITAGTSITGLAATDTPSFEQLQQQIEQQKRALEAQQQALENTQLQLQRLRDEAGQQAITSQPATAADAPDTGAHAAHQTDATHQPTQVGTAPANEEAERVAQVAPIMDQPGVLTPRGRFVLEPSLEYGYSSTNRVATVGYTIIPAIIVGLIDIRRVNSTTVVAALTGRYGISNRWEIEAKLPYVYRSDKTISRPYGTGSANDEVFSSRGHHIGDVELGVRYQFNQGGMDKPYFIGNVRAIFPTGKGPFDINYAGNSTSLTGMALQTEQPTGSGFYGLQTGVQMIMPSDPAVFYAGLNYLWRFSRNINKDVGGTYIGKVDPGNAIELNFGMGMALNDRSSLSFGYQHTYIQKTRFKGRASYGDTSAQIGRLLFGYSYRLASDTNLNMTLSTGVTHDAPDVSLTFRVPFNF